MLSIFKYSKKKNFKIIGYGATAKSCTVLNYCGIGSEYIDYFYDTTSFKINKYLYYYRHHKNNMTKLKSWKIKAWKELNKAYKKKDIERLKSTVGLN